MADSELDLDSILSGEAKRKDPATDINLDSPAVRKTSKGSNPPSMFGIKSSIAQGAQEIVPDVLRSTVAGASGGLLEFIKTGGNLLDDAGDFITKSNPMGRPVDFEALQTENDVRKVMREQPINQIRDKVNTFWEPGQTLPGKLARPMAQWLSVAAPAKQALAIKNGLVAWTLAGGIGDFAAMDPYEERLANIMSESDNPLFSNALTKWLASDKDDPELEARMKQAVEGGLLGITFSSFIRVAKIAKGSIKAKGTINSIARMFDRPSVINKSAEDIVDKTTAESIVVKDPSVFPSHISPQQRSQFPTNELEGLLEDVDMKSTDALVKVAKSFIDGSGGAQSIVIRTVDGKPDKILEGAELIQIAKSINKQNLTVKTVDISAAQKMDEDAKIIQDIFDEALEVSTQNRSKISDTLKNAFSGRRWIDVSEPIRGKILKVGGDEAEASIRNLDSIAGATAKARKEFTAARTQIYDGLNRTDTLHLDHLITSHRISQIDKYRTGKDAIKHRKDSKGAQYENYILKLREELGPEKFNDLQVRATNHFEAMRGQLKQLQDNGIISKEQFETLNRFDYTPTEYVDLIDPIIKQEIGGKVRISVPDSGILRFDKGKDSVLNNDQRLLLSQVVARTQARISKNNANLSLKSFAEANPENGFVSVKKFKGGSPVKVMVDGKPENIYIQDSLVTSWTSQNPEMSTYLANFLRIGSGTALVKPLLTGHNPGFVLTSFPMDVGLAFLASSKSVGYSNAFPKFAIQLSKNLQATAGDAFKRKGTFNDFLDEGGGSDFFADEGRDFIVTGNKNLNLFGSSPEALAANAKIDRKWGDIKNATSYINHSFDLWMRLALRDQGIKNGLDPKEATYQARRYFDLSRGGSTAKALDNLIPYFNVMIQGGRSVFRSGVEDPKGMAEKIGWLSSMAVANHYWNYSVHPDAYEAVSDKRKGTHVNLTTGLKLRDGSGNIRHLYFSVKKEPVSIPLTIMVDAASISAFSKKGDIDDTLFEAVQTGFVDLASAIPSMQMYKQYVENRDYWGNPVWKGKDTPVGTVDPKMEFTGDGSRVGDTPEIYKQLGEGADYIPGVDGGLSPVRMQNAIGSLAENNTYTDVLGSGYQTLMTGLPEDFMDQHVLELIAGNPTLRRVIRLTHPLEKSIEEGRNLSKPFKNERAETNRQMDIRLKKIETEDMTTNEVVSWIKSNPESNQPRLMRSLGNYIEVTAVFDKLLPEAKRGGDIEDGYSIPAKHWWLGLANEPVDEAKGIVFYNAWRDANERDRKRMERVAGAIKGFWTAGTYQEFMKQREQWGDEE